MNDLSRDQNGIQNSIHIPNLTTLSDAELLRDTKLAVKAETTMTYKVLHYLREVEMRRLYCEGPHSTMHVYCVKELGYDDDQAQKRIAAMRLLKELPQIESKVASGEFSLTVLNKAKTAFNKMEKKLQENNKKKNNEKSSKNSDNSGRDADARAGAGADTVPGTSLKNTDETDKIFTLPLENKLEILKSLEGKTTRECDRELIKICPEAIPKKTESTRPITGELSELKILIPQKTLDKLAKLKNLLSHQKAKLSTAELIDRLADLMLLKIDPEEKAKMKAKVRVKEVEVDKAKNEKTIDANNSERPAAQHVDQLEKEELKGPSAQEGRSHKQSRYIPLEVRRETWVRDQGQCSFVDPLTKQRCESRFKLELDHIIPFGMGGNHATENLRLLCRNHNTHHAIKTYGREKMAPFIRG